MIGRVRVRVAAAVGAVPSSAGPSSFIFVCSWAGGALLAGHVAVVGAQGGSGERSG